MKANELRIGNWVEWANEFKKVVAIDSQCSTIQVDNLVLIDYDEKKFKPIPLTEEWLIKFGFGTELGFPNEYFNNVALEQVVIVYDLTHSLFNLETDSGDVININIQHVHQLQNIYFALTNEELTIK